MKQTMPPPPRVSVVVITKNRPQLLSEAVASVAAQTWRDLEIIVVDDCSTPPVEGTALPIPSELPLTVHRMPEPSGAVNAKNRGVELARGEILAFLDDDDLYKPGYIQRAVEILDRVPDADVAFMSVEYFHANGTVDPSIYSCVNHLAAMGRQVPPFASVRRFGEELLPFLLLEGIPMAFQRPVVRRRAFDGAGGYQHVVYWDGEWAVRAIAAGLRPVLVHEQLYLQRTGGDQMYSSAAKLSHCERQIEMTRHLWQSLAPGDPRERLFRRAVAKAHFDSAYSHREHGEFATSILQFAKSQRLAFQPAKLRFLAGSLRALLRSKVRI